MKHTEVKQYVKDNNLLPYISTKSGIYCITIDNYICYIGQSQNMYERCCTHICNIYNAVLTKDKRYELLLAAQLGGHKIEFYQVDFCKQKKLLPLEEEYIRRFMPPLNIRTPDGDKELPDTIEDLLVNLRFKVFQKEDGWSIEDCSCGILPYTNNRYKKHVKMIQEISLHDYTCKLNQIPLQQLPKVFNEYFNGNSKPFINCIYESGSIL